MYNLQEAQRFVDNAATATIPKTVIIHQITNDIAKISASRCVRQMRYLARSIKAKQQDCRVLVSLAPPSLDTKLNNNITTVNKILTIDSTLETINHDNIFMTNGKINNSLFYDNVHPNALGFKRLMDNIKEAITH